MDLEDKWKKAEENLEDFNRMMEILKKYPIKPQPKEVKALPYEIEGPIKYPSC
jgi:hypothetical protein